MHLDASASSAVLETRARVKASVRAFFAARGVLEVDTPALSQAATPDPAVESIEARLRFLGTHTAYLHTSPEYAMKRLLVGHSRDLYQISRVFRDGELGRWHQPEFLLLEWYRRGFTDLALMADVEALIAAVMRECGRKLESVRMTYQEAFVRALDVDPLGDISDLAKALSRRGVDVPAGLAGDGLLDLALGAVVVRRFAPGVVTFVHDYPATQAALAKIKDTTPPVAARFEAFVGDLELANGFQELTDAAEQRRRFENELNVRRRAGRPAPPLDEAFLAALEAGLPPCAGVALGLDRLIALAAGVDNLAAALTFAHRL
ncbi:MAG TPA: EF-P lysine aminoacylase EpmA [Gammaproteobacteria bacterium]|jgi:lysyl-tRNA synthetase class 2